jgi:hypothetical protein
VNPRRVGGFHNVNFDDSGLLECYRIVVFSDPDATFFPLQHQLHSLASQRKGIIIDEIYNL